jgi:hypothetical protein
MEDLLNLHVAAVHNRDRYDAEKLNAGKEISGWALWEICHLRMLCPTLTSDGSLPVQWIAK